MKIFPAIDLRSGRVVRLERGRFDRETVYGSDPLQVARTMARSGARRVHVVDLDGAGAGRPRQTETIGSIARETDLAVQAGGGVRGGGHVEELLASGVAAVVIGSLAVREPGLTGALLDEHGAKIVLAADCRVGDDGAARIASAGWAETGVETVEETIGRFASAGLVSYLCTDVDRDGMLEGPNFSLYERLTREIPDVALIASGGVRDLDDLKRLADCGCEGVIVGKALYEGKIDLAEALRLEGA